MSCLSWNCTGMGNRDAVRLLLDLIRDKKPDIVFLMETLANAETMDRIKNKIGFEGLFTIDRSEGCRGLAMLWRHNENVRVMGSSDRHIDLEIKLMDTTSYRVTGFYGWPNRNQRHLSWALLRELATTSSLPWVIFGDFNELLDSSEKRGRGKHPHSLMENFRKAIDECGLFDLGYEGSPFTWERHRGTQEWVQERLDRCLANGQWKQRFVHKVFHIPYSTSDHLPILLEIKHFVRKCTRLFRFENHWLAEEDCGRLITNCWRETVGSDLCLRLQECSARLDVWGKDFMHKFKTRIRYTQQKIGWLKQRWDASSVAELSILEKQLQALLKQEEEYWAQRGKLFWLQEGDLNTRAFHAAATSRRRKNTISRLMDDEGNWHDHSNGVDQVVLQYFRDLFKSHQGDMFEVLQSVDTKVTAEQNEELCSPFRREEIRTAVFGMHPSKSPGADGLNPGFFQRYWSTIGDDITDACIHWLEEGRLPEGLNDTLIVLIPKKHDAVKMSNLRPISLCNVLYKVLSKTLANRLKCLLPEIIGESQSAFVPGRLITDNIVIAYEIMHYMRRKKEGKVGYGALKLDISKAYDKIEWGFLRNMMAALGFSNRWINLVMMCIENVQFSILFGGDKVGPVCAERGLRQGCPLSPYLFIICAQGLSDLLKRAESQGRIHGIKIARGAPIVSHLFFADDSYLFFKATESEGREVRGLLQVYEQASGQGVNFAKSSICFSNNTKVEIRRSLTAGLMVTEALEHSSYLGMPISVGRNKSAIFEFVKRKVQNKISSWTGRLLSKAGKVLMLKTVAQSVPNYLMSLFLLPQGLCEEIEKLMNGFLWGSYKKDGRGIRWRSWKRLCHSKFTGGLGFRKLHEFNLALLGKQGWRLLTNPDSLVAKLLKARYFSKSSFLEAELTSAPSFVWRSIWEAKGILQNGCGFRVGDGRNIQVWFDPWIPSLSGRRFQPPVAAGLENLHVSDLMEEGTSRWDESKLGSLFNQHDVEAILSIPLSNRRVQDTWYWHHEKSGNYTVKSGYRVAIQQSNERLLSDYSDVWRLLWKVKAPPKMIHFMWQVLSDCLPTRYILQTRSVPIDSLCCPLCDGCVETCWHLFVTCPFAENVWRKVGLSFDVNGLEDCKQWLCQIDLLFNRDQIARVIAICWSLWQIRNEKVWRKTNCSMDQVIHRGISLLDGWAEAQNRKSSSAVQSSLPSSSVWQKPIVGWQKVNTDAAVFSDYGGFSAVFRDESGRLIGAFTQQVPHVKDPQVLEALAIREVLCWLKERHKTNVIVESDCLLAVNEVNFSKVNRSYFGSICLDCKLLLATLSNVRVEFVRRSANSAAHTLAREAQFLSGRFVWGYTPPDCIVSIIRNEMQ